MQFCPHSTSIVLQAFARALLSFCALAAPLLLTMPATAQAESATDAAEQDYDIVAGTLDSVLNEFSGRAGVLLAFDAGLTSGKTSHGLKGRYSVTSGFVTLLSGSGLQVQTNTDGSYSLAPAPATADGVTLMHAVKVEGQMLSEQSTENTLSYTAPAVSVGSKLPQSLREVPRSISVISQQQLQDQRITTLDEVMAQMPGVTSVPGGTGYAATSYYSRGFQITSVMVDGSPAAAWSGQDTSSNTGMSKYDSVQLLRGPDGIFSGNGEPSGSINLVRKQPLDHFQLKYALSAGSWDNYYGELDVTDKLIDSGRIRGRFVAAYNDRQFFYDGADRQIATLYGSIAADLGRATTLTAGLSRDQDRGSGRDSAPGFPRYADGSPIPIPRRQGYTDWSFKDTDSENYFVSLDHAFNESWKLRANVSRSESDFATNVSSYNNATDPLTGTGSYLFQGTWAEGEFSTTAIDAHLSGDFEWLNRTHRVVIGADHRESKNYTPLYYSTAGRADITDWSNTDPNDLLPTNSRGDIDWAWIGATRQQGLYGYADLQIIGALNLVLGGRYSNYQVKNGNGDVSTGMRPPYLTSNDISGIFTPYYALKYAISEHWSTYFAAAESFEDQSTYFTEDDKPLDPTRGRSFELGIKGEHWDGRLNSNLTVYHSRRDQYRVQVSTPPESFDRPGRSCCWSGDGEFLSEGVEVEVSGQILRSWQLNGGYTYDDNETKFGANDGLRVASFTPKHIFRVWTRYDLPGVLSSWTVGGGVKAQSSFFRSGTVRAFNPTGGADGTGAYDGAAVPFQFTEPGRAIWNAFVEHRLPAQMTLALNANNVFDKRYFRSVLNNSGGNIYGEPRNLMLTLRGSFGG